MVGRALASGYGVGSVLLFTNHMRFWPTCKISSVTIAVKIEFELSKFMNETNLKYTFGMFPFRCRRRLPLLLFLLSRWFSNSLARFSSSFAAEMRLIVFFPIRPPYKLYDPKWKAQRLWARLHSQLIFVLI